MFHQTSIFCVLVCLFVSLSVKANEKELAQIAVLPDIHFHDVYAQFSDNSYAGIPLTKNKNAVIRSMSAQLRSTRLFNENYFALKQALKNIVNQGTKIVILPGDFTDDGQPLHIKGLDKILTAFEKKHGLRFFITNGNHDPSRPHDTPAGKSNFLDKHGQELAIFSHQHSRCKNAQTQKQLICSDDVMESGYASIINTLKTKGFFPDKRDLYWATPFSDYAPNYYDFIVAKQQSDLANRQWKICRNGKTKICKQVIDSSYVVEPIEGIWLLAIDANVYVPQIKNGQFAGFSGSGNQGYNGVVQFKPQLLDWIKNVVEQAKANGKKLISFSHFPMAPYYDGQEERIKKWLGPLAMQMIRSPNEETIQALLDTGLTFHIGGHMHINDTQSLNRNDDTGLVNIQAPSIAAYRPAFKTLSVYQNGIGKLTTQLLSNVDNFDSFFPLYRREQAYLSEIKSKNQWNKRILNSNSYNEFADTHLRELARLRFIPEEWLMLEDKNEFLQTSAWDVINSQFSDSKDLFTWLQLNNLSNADLQWTILDLMHDLYRYRNAGSLAHLDVSPQRNKIYDAMTLLLQCKLNKEHKLTQNVVLPALKLLQGFRIGEPDDTTWIDLYKGTVLKSNF